MTTRWLEAGAMALGVWACAISPARAEEGDETWPPEDAEVIDGIVAVVNNDLITRYELERAIAPFEAQAEAGGETLDEAKRHKIRADVLEGLVNDLLILGEANKMKLETKQSQVDEQLERLKAGNQWDDDELAEALQQAGFPSIAAYRAHVEKELLKNQVLSIKVASRVQVDEEEVQRAFDRELASAGGLSQRRAAHILLRLDEFATPDDEAAAQQKLLEMRERVLAGESTFEEEARRYSQDTNAASGGDLGWFGKGDLDPTFEAAVWKLGEGEMSPPVRTEFGYHLILLTGERRKDTATEEERETLKRQIRFRLREKELERLYAQWIKALRADSFIEVRKASAGLE
ncbi:MAG: peptidylprolyl isomerase [Deltaproteobacteria bacterium]|nr:peptidylprolyl isomerase [Deltaproteobacteria bacterium]